MPSPAEAQHPIGVVAERTGLSPDVLRVWERRYKVVSPRRSPGGQRVYSDADIERLDLLNRATQRGHSISHVASLGKGKLEDLVRQVESTPARADLGELRKSVEPLMAFTEAMDSAGLEAILKRGVARYGITVFIDEIAAPFLRAIGDGWHAGTVSVAQEHLASAMVQKVVSDTAPLLTGGDSSPTIVIATLEGERHANGALMAATTAASEGWRVVYLGADLPASEIAAAATRAGARAVGVSMVIGDKKKSNALRDLMKAMPDNITLFVGGAAARHITHSRTHEGEVVFVETMSDLRSKLAALLRKSA
jgi:DNA-binding transcriptional MerR regulator/methylmalonyl-CoA mutase cobalamin-binding subunit